MLQRRHFQESQFGQGMVEYAILLILTVTLVVGGIELASATLASGKASDAAEAGASDLAAINETRLKAQENQQKYLRQLDNLFNAGVVQVNENGLLVASEAMNPEETDTPITTYDDFVRFLDSFSKDYIELELADGETLTTELTEEYLVFFNDLAVGSTEPDFKNILLSGADPVGTNYTALENVFDKIDGITDDDASGVVDSADKDGEIVLAELIQAIQKSTEIDTDNDGDIDERFNLITDVINLNPVTDAAGDDALLLKFRSSRLKALMLIEEVQLSMLPLDPRVTRDNGLSESTILIGNHIPNYVANTSEFQRPACTVNGGTGELEYSTGFPGTDDADGIAKTAVELETGVTIDAPAVYLFNPLPVDAVSCQGNDPTRGGRSRMSILIGGYTDKNNPANNFSGLPKLNQAFYGQYNRVCLDNANSYVACGRANVSQELLKPPGKFCLNTVATPGVDSCPGLDAEHIETSGYYFWGYSNAANPSQNENERFKWIYDGTAPPEFRPTMQLICNDQIEDGEMELISGEACDPTLSIDPVKSVRINVRYRSVFESFLTFGLMELTDLNNVGNLADYFYDPSNLRALGNGSVGVPIAGSELGPKGSNKNPTVKNFKDFRGCYDINIETNAVTSCN